MRKYGIRFPRQLFLDTTQPQMAIHINRQRAADVGISVDTISAAVQTVLSGKDLGNYYVGDNAIEILAKVPDGMVQDTSALDPWRRKPR